MDVEIPFGVASETDFIPTSRINIMEYGAAHKVISGIGHRVVRTEIKINLKKRETTG